MIFIDKKLEALKDEVVLTYHNIPCWDDWSKPAELDDVLFLRLIIKTTTKRLWKYHLLND